MRINLALLAENDYIDAAKEFLTVYLLSNLPFGFLVLSHYLNNANIDVSWTVVAGVLQKNWKPGEILIFMSALLAPFCFVMCQYNRARRHMPGYWLFLFALVTLYPAASYIFAHDRLSAIKNEEFVRNSSLTLYVIALAIWYFGLVFQRQLHKPPKDDGEKRADKLAAQLGEAGA